MRKNFLFLLRIFIGLLFTVSGGEKLLSPYQNFLYVIQGYQLIPSPFDTAVAMVFPWVEFILGLFVLAGLWTRRALAGCLMMVTGFILILGQALARRLPLDDCGCFGALVHVPPSATILLDAALFAVIAVLLLREDAASRFSLDRYFDGKEKGGVGGGE